MLSDDYEPVSVPLPHLWIRLREGCATWGISDAGRLADVAVLEITLCRIVVVDRVRHDDGAWEHAGHARSQRYRLTGRFSTIDRIAASAISEARRPSTASGVTGFPQATASAKSRISVRYASA